METDARHHRRAGAAVRRGGRDVRLLLLGRLDDIARDSSAALAEMIATLRPYDAGPLVLAASIRTPRHAVDAARLGSDIATIPVKVLRQMTSHPLTDAGIARFDRDWTAFSGGDGAREWTAGTTRRTPAAR